MNNETRAEYPCGSNKGLGSKFRGKSWLRQEGSRIRPKRCTDINKDEDNSPKNRYTTKNNPRISFSFSPANNNYFSHFCNVLIHSSKIQINFWDRPLSASQFGSFVLTSLSYVQHVLFAFFGVVWGGEWPNSFWFIGCSFNDLFQTVRRVPIKSPGTEAIQ